MCTWKSLDTCRFIGRFPLELYADFPCIFLHSHYVFVYAMQSVSVSVPFATKTQLWGKGCDGKQHARIYTFKSGRKQLAIIYTMYFMQLKVQIRWIDVIKLCECAMANVQIMPLLDFTRSATHSLSQMNVMYIIQSLSQIIVVALIHLNQDQNCTG